MKTISLNDKVIARNNTTIGEILLLLVLDSDVDLEEARKSLLKKGYITAFFKTDTENSEYALTKKGSELLIDIIVESDKHQEPEERLNSLASQLKEIFPKGKKPGTNYYWAEGIALIVKRLKLFFRKYGNDYTDEQILQAAKKYIEGFNGDYTYMKILKYFILKDKVGADGCVESESELINYIENAGQENELSNNWTLTLV